MSLAKDFRSLPSEMRLTAVAAGALAVTLILPWYQKSYFQSKAIQRNVSGLGAFTWVEAAVLLVAVAVVFLVWARSQKKAFHLPGGDGVAITVAGGWAVLLLVYRLFDKPDIKGSDIAGATIGIQWGIFFALAAAGALVAAGARVRAAHRPEPPNPAADDVGWVAPERPPRERTDRRPREASAVADVLRERPAWEAEPPAGRRRDEEQTRRFRDDDEATRRMSGGEPRRPLGEVPEWSGDAAPPDRGRDEDAETRRFRDDDAETRRFRDDDAETRRMRGDDAPPPPGERPPRLWDDDESA